MVEQFEIKIKTLNEDLVIIRVKYTNYYKVIIQGKDSGVKKVKKIKDFDDLLKQFIELAIKNAFLDTKVEILEKQIEKMK